jgi:hypothetical protein
VRALHRFRLHRLGIIAMFTACGLPGANSADAQTSPAPWPWASATPASENQPPPREIPLIEIPWEQLSNKEVGEDGAVALSIKPEKWKHAETDNFIIHFRRVTEAHKVVREIEYDLWFVARTLGATPAQYRHKSHVFVFEDENEWQEFLSRTKAPAWSGSFARRDELFLSIRKMEMGGQFDSHTLAHETTHAVVARVYPFEHWPVWLNEGFAEYMGGASVAARNHQPVKNYQQILRHAGMSIEEMFELKRYPQDEEKVWQLYQTGEKFVRFLMNELPKDRFRKFVTDVITSNDTETGNHVEQAFMRVYGDKFKTFDDFKRKFATFSR